MVPPPSEYRSEPWLFTWAPPRTSTGGTGSFGPDDFFFFLKEKTPANVGKSQQRATGVEFRSIPRDRRRFLKLLAAESASVAERNPLPTRNDRIHVSVILLWVICVKHEPSTWINTVINQCSCIPQRRQKSVWPREGVVFVILLDLLTFPRIVSPWQNEQRDFSVLFLEFHTCLQSQEISPFLCFYFKFVFIFLFRSYLSTSASIFGFSWNWTTPNDVCQV